MQELTTKEERINAKEMVRSVAKTFPPIISDPLMIAIDVMEKYERIIDLSTEDPEIILPAIACVTENDV